MPRPVPIHPFVVHKLQNVPRIDSASRRSKNKTKKKFVTEKNTRGPSTAPARSFPRSLVTHQTSVPRLLPVRRLLSGVAWRPSTCGRLLSVLLLSIRRLTVLLWWLLLSVRRLLAILRLSVRLLPIWRLLSVAQRRLATWRIWCRAVRLLPCAVRRRGPVARLRRLARGRLAAISCLTIAAVLPWRRRGRGPPRGTTTLLILCIV
ncbi:uncharacterized protein BJX67DRAFT_250092 [Aspergillus lucknowensis]|uniref:Uncharacterized protein n=1 Tax=Aspergillus lucknowensis TaxID=176173 RepID=A0ABR4M281_9EURO